MSLGDLYRKRYRRRRRQRMLRIALFLMLMAIVLVAVRACGDRIDRSLRSGYRPLDEAGKEFLKQQLKELEKEAPKKNDQQEPSN